jgi:hypothetical protein
MALVFAQPLTEMSTASKALQAPEADNLTTMCELIV